MTQGLMLSIDQIRMTSMLDEKSVKMLRQPGKNTLNKLQAVCSEFCDFALANLASFNGIQPETLAISIVLAARKEVRLIDQKPVLEQLFGRQIDFAIQNALTVLQQLLTATNFETNLKSSRTVHTAIPKIKFSKEPNTEPNKD